MPTAAFCFHVALSFAATSSRDALKGRWAHAREADFAFRWLLPLEEGFGTVNAKSASRVGDRRPRARLNTPEVQVQAQARLTPEQQCDE